MYLVLELKSNRRVLFESHQEADEYLKLNNLHDQVQAIREIDQGEYNAIMRETVKDMQQRRKQANI